MVVYTLQLIPKKCFNLQIHLSQVFWSKMAVLAYFHEKIMLIKLLIVENFVVTN